MTVEGPVTAQITASRLYDLVQCPRRVALDVFGDITKRDQINPFVKLLWERGSNFEKETIERLNLPFVDLSNLEEGEKEKATTEAMGRGESLIYSGRIRCADMIGVPDILRKEAHGYVPGDIKSGSAEESGGGEEDEGKPKLHYAVQLALYVDVLEQLGRSAGRRGFIWDVHGREVTYDLTAPQGPRKPQSLWDEYQSALNDAKKILSRSWEPLGAHASACKLCHWYMLCVGELKTAGDLTLIPMLGRSLRDTMIGTFATVSDLASANVDEFILDKKKTLFAGIGEDRLRTFHRRAELLTTPDARPYLKNVVALPNAVEELFFDIEVDPMRDVCYLHGIIERIGRDNDSERFVYFFADEETLEAERDAFEKAINYFRSKADGAIYYYSKYERTIYRKLQAKYPEVCPVEEIEALFSIARATDLYFDVVLKATEWPTLDLSIKSLAKYLGFSWRDKHPSGAASIEWFDRWCKDRDPKIRQRILDYNEDDCRATRVLLDGIRAL